MKPATHDVSSEPTTSSWESTTPVPVGRRAFTLPERPRPRSSRKTFQFERWMLQRALETVGNPPITVELWNGERFSTGNRQENITVVVHDRGALRRILLDPGFQFAEMYSAGRLDVQGKLADLMLIADQGYIESGAGGLFLNRVSSWLHRRHASTLAAARRNIQYHYDIGNDFYRLWLDNQLLYSCAYFPSPGCSLEEAQIAKMEHVCRKLRLRPDERVVEAGCGWGALALYMARQYGVTVDAYNISTEQIKFARERAAAERLADRVRFVEDDWRNINGVCDALVSIGMLEHVGIHNYRKLGDVIDGCLTRQGRGLIHTIGRNFPNPLDAWTEQQIFPGARPPALSEMAVIFEPHDFSILDVENLRLHYAETLRHWLRRFEQSAETVRQMFDERFVRMWRLYLAASVAAFESGSLQLFQVTFARGMFNEIPWSREYLYRPHEVGE